MVPTQKRHSSTIHIAAAPAAMKPVTMAGEAMKPSEKAKPEIEFARPRILSSARLLSRGPRVGAKKISPNPNRALKASTPATRAAGTLGSADSPNRAQAAAVTIFDLKMLATIGEVKVTGAAPTQIIFDPATKLVFTLNRRGYSMTAIDAMAGTVAGTIDTLESTRREQLLFYRETQLPAGSYTVEVIAHDELDGKTSIHTSSLGIAASGEVGDSDPLQAMEDALRTFGADEIIISTHPEGRSHWLERGIVEKARERFAVPITHVVVDLERDREKIHR